MSANSDSSPARDGSFRKRLMPYLTIARPDHWFKNVFMLSGALIAFFYQPDLFNMRSVMWVALATVVSCLIASSNYVLNEIQDAGIDRQHPVKRTRPLAAGHAAFPIAYVEWALLGLAGLSLAARMHSSFLATAACFWVLGLAYNLPPLRLKSWQYIDALAEALNNPVRLCLGWFAVIPDRVPPVSLLIAYWMAGAYFMTVKRWAERRRFQEGARGIRDSTRNLNPQDLLLCALFYAVTAGLFGGIFVVRYHLELILFLPFAAGFLTYYLKAGMRDDSLAQHPEKLYRDRELLLYGVLCLLLFIALMFVHIPQLYDWFNVTPRTVDPLWTIGAGR